MVAAGHYLGDVTEEFLLGEGYLRPRRLESGVWLAIQKQLFTTGLFYIKDRLGYEKMYHYDKMSDAVNALLTWDGEGDPPRNWIVEKSINGDRRNPLTDFEEEWQMPLPELEE
jgi:hypothetical protein